MRRKQLVIPVAVVVLLGAGALVTHHIHTAADAAVPKSTGTEARSQSSAQNAPIAVVTAVAERRDVPITKSAVGWIEPVAQVAIRPRLDGVVVEKAVADGASVKAGDLLLRLDDKALQASLAKDRATLAKDQATVEQLAADLARLKTLHGHDDATEQQLEQQQASVDEAAASVAGDQAQIQSDEVAIGYTTISAPIAGRVGVVNATLGALVHTTDQTPLLTITEMAPLRVSFQAPERDLDAFRQALQSSAPTPVRALDPESGKTIATGRLSFIDSSVDPASGTVTVKADFDNADGALWPGEYVGVEAELGINSGATVIPMVSVQVNDKGSFVFVAGDDGKARVQAVSMAADADDTAVVASGVNPGDHVVVEGQLRLRDGSPVAETVASADAAKQGGSADAGPATP